MHIPKAVCEPCGLEMTLLKIGVVVEFIAGGGPYFKISADRFECQRCRTKVLAGFARVPLSEPFMTDYDDYAAEVKAEL